MSEVAQCFQWIVSTCQADTTLMASATGGIWTGFADQGTIAPYVLIVQQASPDALTMQGVRLFARLLLQIKGISPASQFATLVTVANRLDALFKDKRNVALSLGGVLSCYRESSLAYDEVSNGVHISHLGGLYHIDLQGS